MTITTAAPEVSEPGLPRSPAAAGNRRRGFTLVEVMVSAGLGSLVLAGVLTAFVFFCRTAFSLSYYSEMEADTRVALARFAQDARQTNAANWQSQTSLVFQVNGTNVTYTYDAAEKTFTRTEGGRTEVLASSVNAFSFKAYNIKMEPLNFSSASLTTLSAATKLIQIDLDMSREAGSSKLATQQILSSRYVLRNKKVS